MAGSFAPPDLLESYQDALDILDDSLASVSALIEAHRKGHRLSELTLARLQKQCTAAAVAAKRLRSKLAHFKAKSRHG